MARAKKEKSTTKSALHDVVVRDYTIRIFPLFQTTTNRLDLHKRVLFDQTFRASNSYQVYGATFKKRAPRAVKAIKEFAKLHMVSSFSPDCAEYYREQMMSDSTLS